jgi:hypothetical protein
MPETDEGAAFNVNVNDVDEPDASVVVAADLPTYPALVTRIVYDVPAVTVAAKEPSAPLVVDTAFEAFAVSSIATDALRSAELPSETVPVMRAVFGVSVKAVPLLRCPGPTVIVVEAEMNPVLRAVTVHVPG